MGELGGIAAEAVLPIKDTLLSVKGAGVKESPEREGVIGEHLAVFQRSAEKRGTNPVEGGLFMMVDGIEYTDLFGNTDGIDVNTDGERMAVGRVGQVRQFETNNGVMTYVDETGRQWLGAATTGNYDALHNAGYERGGIFVPFSNGETPTDPKTERQIRDILSGKEKNQLEEERVMRVDEIINLRNSLFGSVAIIPERDEIYEEVVKEGESRKQYVEKSEKNRMVEDLKPHDEDDDAGYMRRIYKYGNITFSFKGREEMPVYPTCERSKTEMFGEPPSLIDQEEFGRYKEQLEETQGIEQSTSHFIANKSLQGVIDLAIRLGSKDPSLLKLSGELKEGVYSQRALDLLDALVAVNYADAIVNKREDSADIDAEAVVLMGLVGDERAQKYTAESVDVLKSYDRANVSRIEQSGVGYEPLRIQDLCVVHATKFMPEPIDEGEYRIKTTFDAQAQDRNVPRHTIHTALNHTVEGHGTASWDRAGHVIISPLSEMLGKNGLPENLSTVDTYWERDPGEGLVFPDADLVVPGGPDVEGFYKKKDGVFKFKSEGLEMADLLSLKDYSEKNQYLGNFSNRIERTLNLILNKLAVESTVSSGTPGGQWDYIGVEEAMYRFLHESTHQEERGGLLDVLTQDTDGNSPESIKDAISKILVESKATKYIGIETEDRGAAVTLLAEKLAGGVETVVFAEIKEIAVRDAIEGRGFSVQPGGNWAWGGSTEVTGQTVALGKELGVSSVSIHAESAHGLFEEQVEKQVLSAREGKRPNGKFDWKRYPGKYHALLPQITPKSRRVLYDSGLLTSRV